MKRLSITFGMTAVLLLGCTIPRPNVVGNASERTKNAASAAWTGMTWCGYTLPPELYVGDLSLTGICGAAEMGTNRVFYNEACFLNREWVLAHELLHLAGYNHDTLEAADDFAERLEACGYLEPLR